MVTRSTMTNAGSSSPPPQWEPCLAVASSASSNKLRRPACTGNCSFCPEAKPSLAACKALNLKHRFTRPYTPRTNGKAERFIQTTLREWAYARTYQNSNQRSQELPRWLHQYNWHRPHSSLGLSPPISRSCIDDNNLLKHHI